MNLIFLFVLGTIVGSFLNVVALRWDWKHPGGWFQQLGGRSKCSNCSKTLRWFELVPVISFILQRGRCRNCGYKLSYQYLIVEILTGIVFITAPVWILPVFSVYVVILVYDFHHKIIPDELVYLAIFLSIVYGLINFQDYTLMDALAGPIIFLFFASIWFLSRGRAMGFGDAKLGFSVGVLLGATKGFSAIVLAFWSGALFAIVYMFLAKTSLPAGRHGFIKSGQELTMKSEVPFAPFIILGAWLSLFYELNLFYVL